MKDRAEQELMATWWHFHYLKAARDSYPDICADHELAVGFKLTSPTGKSFGGYYWPLVDGDHDEPRLHVADAWDERNTGSCPSAPGDGLCVATTIKAAQSGGARFGSSAGHVLVYPRALAVSDTDGKWRAPWVIDVDCFTAEELVRARCLGFADLGSADLGSANLGSANLRFANLGSANLRYADLSGADLSGADLRYADLRYANLRSADLSSARANRLTLWPTGFDPVAVGVIVDPT